jgi:hypothetical protein
VASTKSNDGVKTPSKSCAMEEIIEHGDGDDTFNVDSECGDEEGHEADVDDGDFDDNDDSDGIEDDDFYEHFNGLRGGDNTGNVAGYTFVPDLCGERSLCMHKIKSISERESKSVVSSHRHSKSAQGIALGS